MCFPGDDVIMAAAYLIMPTLKNIMDSPEDKSLNTISQMCLRDAGNCCSDLSLLALLYKISAFLRAGAWGCGGDDHILICHSYVTSPRLWYEGLPRAGLLKCFFMNRKGV